MSTAEQIVLDFWQTVWNPPYDLDFIDSAVTEDFVITSAGKDIVSRAAFKDWVAGFQQQIADLRLEPQETFANPQQTRVVSRWKMSGFNNGLFGLPANRQPVVITGIAIWELRGELLAHNWVERSAFETWSMLQ